MKKLINAELYKLRLSREFWLFVFSCLSSAVFSVLIIKLLGMFIDTIPIEIIEKMKFGNMYNFGFIQVYQISELYDMNASFVISSAFKNYCPTLGVAAFVSLFIKKEFSYGGIRNFLFKGFSRKDVLISKLLVISIGILFTLILYFLGYVFTSLIAFGVDVNSELSLFNTSIFLANEIIIHIAFAVICIMISICFRNPMSIFLNSSLIVTGTIFINNLVIFSKGRYDLSKYWILDYATKMSPLVNSDYRQFVITVFFTISASYLITKKYFMKMQFE